MKRQIIVMLFVVVVLVGTIRFFYVTPGVWRYRYYEMDSSMTPPPGLGGRVRTVTHSMRTDRLTGQVQVYQQGRWQKANN